MKGTLTEIKNNPQEARIQTNDLDHKEDINIQPKQQEETRIKKNEDRLWNPWDISKPANI